jgi:hypothetical protein
MASMKPSYGAGGGSRTPHCISVDGTATALRTDRQHRCMVHRPPHPNCRAGRASCHPDDLLGARLCSRRRPDQLRRRRRDHCAPRTVLAPRPSVSMPSQGSPRVVGFLPGRAEPLCCLCQWVPLSRADQPIEATTVLSKLQLKLDARFHRSERSARPRLNGLHRLMRPRSALPRPAPVCRCPLRAVAPS